MGRRRHADKGPAGRSGFGAQAVHRRLGLYRHELPTDLAWHGITVYGTIDAGFGWQSHGAPFDLRSAVTASYLIQKQNRTPRWTLAANGLSNSTIGIKGTLPIAGNFSTVFALDAGFNPYSFRFSDGPGSVARNAGVPQDQATAYSDSSRAGQWYNGVGYVGVSSPTYGTLTVFRQNALTLDAVFDYDPFGASYAFSPIGFQGITCGGGNTENCRHSTSLKYRVNVGDFRAAALWQFGGYGQNNASRGAYQFQAGADISPWGYGVLSFDAIYSYVRDSVALSLGPGTNAANGAPIPPFLPQNLTATISDNEAVMLVAKYANGPLKLYAGYEHIRYMAPSDPQTAFTDISGDFLCQGCAAINNASINNTAFGVNGLGNKTFHVMWVGTKYAVTETLDVIAAYYHYTQESFFGTSRRACPLLRRRALAMRRDVRRGLCRYRMAVCTKVGCLCRGHVHASEWRIGLRLSPAQQLRSHGRVALPLLKPPARGWHLLLATSAAQCMNPDLMPWHRSPRCDTGDNLALFNDYKITVRT
jgi:predicted porin